MSYYFPDQMAHGAQGNLRPWDVRFDPALPNHLSRTADGGIRFRLITEAAFSQADLVLADGRLHPLEATLASAQTQVWEGVLADPPERLIFTFALKTSGGAAVYRVPAGIANAVERLDRWEVASSEVPAIRVPQWAAGAIVYQIFPERFRNGDPSLDPADVATWGSEPGWLDFQGGDLRGIAEKADYLADLGVGIVYLNPIFTSPSTHRYDAVDYRQVDPMLGGNEGLRFLVGELHRRGIRLILDASFNHCHPTFFAFADLLEHGEASEYASWFLVDDWPPRVLFRPHELAASGFRDPVTYRAYLDRFAAEAGVEVVERTDTGPPVSPTYESWYGVPSLPRVNLADPDARAYFLGIARHWIEEFGIDGWRMDVARYVDFDFWPDFRVAVKEANPDSYLLAEIMGDAAPWVSGDAFDGTMNYTFRQIVVDFLADDSIDGVEAANALVRMYAAYAPETVAVCQNLIGSHDTARFLHHAGERSDRLLLATVLQMTLPGAPGLYYGDEVGMTGGEEPASRGAFPWHDEASWNTGQLDAVRALGSLRSGSAALRSGDLQLLWSDADALAFLRRDSGGGVLVVVDRSGAPRQISLPIAIGDRQVAFGDATASGAPDETVVSLGRMGVAIIR
jgi:glycosidase